MSVARLLLLGLVLTGCTQFPQVDAVEGDAVRDAKYLKLVPLQQLIDVPEAQANGEARDALMSEAEGLAARAGSAASGRLIDPESFPTPRAASGFGPGSSSEAAALTSRLAALRQRARGLSDGAVVDRQTRARMRRGIDRTPY